MNYKDTLSLPKTEYPQKADLTKNEPAQFKRWENAKIYEKIREQRKGAPVYLLHDGPPYANGAVHMGTGINKILKDIVVKYKTMRGFDSPYVPGWDCHGLPIEHKVVIENAGRNFTTLEIRRRCEEYARKYIDVQRSQFKRLHVFGEWERPYLTLDKAYEQGIIETFRDLVRDGYVYKKLKPIHWCMCCETALAEAELEYRDERSHSIYVRFPVSEDVKKLFGLGGKDRVFFLIWTTTPWTLPANVAIAVGPNYEYDALHIPSTSEYLIFADARVAPVMKEAGISEYEIVGKAKGREFENKTYRHNFIDREGRFILADFVSLEDGAGSVHIAPGHGAEDYEIGVKYKLPVLSPVDSKGRFTEEFPLMQGENVFAANKKINDLLVSKGFMLAHSEFSHSYPTCWRCKEPVIFRATEQWFISVDHNDFRAKALAAIKSVKWIPDWGEVRIASMVEERPDWCISRQRAWGVPIPGFTCEKCGTILINAEIVDGVAKIFGMEGSNSWFTHDAAHFIPKGTKCEKCGSTEFKKENDIFDVWFESGSSWKVLFERNFPFPCDLYLEGTDQHRGWFQLSLLPAVATKGVPPFKAVLTHGFMVDEEGMKISKSKPREEKDGLTPEEKKREELYMFFADAQKAAEKFGADVLRLWTASVDYTLDVKLSPEIIERRQGVYRKIRNTFRHMLGNLHDFRPVDAVPFGELDEIDKWLVWQLEKLRKTVTDAYESFQFYTVYHEIHNFCVVVLSSFYLDVQKDLLYCGGPGKPRRSSQTAMYLVTDTLARLAAPILAYSSEEVWKYLPSDGNRRESVHLADWPEPFDHPAIADEKMHEKWELFSKLRALVYREVEELRNTQNLGSSQQVEADLYFKSGVPEILKGQEELFAAVLIASTARFHAGDVPGGRRNEDADPEVAARTILSKNGKCERCWNYRTEVGKFSDNPTICGRCRDVVLRAR